VEEGAVQRAVNKYVQRRWRVVEVVPSEAKKRLLPLREARFVGDKLCWRIRYGVDGVSQRAAPLPWSLLEGGHVVPL
jgi:hypothetical protein